MAGIGFELKKLFRSTGVFAFIRAYGYTGMVTAGPMLLGVAFLLSISYLGRAFGLEKQGQDLLVCMITYALLASLILTSIFSMVTTRYVADMLYQEKEDCVLPSLEGSLSIMLPVGGLLFGIFLIFSGIGWKLILLNFCFFMELVVVWMQMNYLTAIKDYKGIMYGYLVAIVVSVLVTILLSLMVGVSLIVLMFAVTCGYGSMMCFHFFLLYRFFENSGENPYEFLRWFDEFGSLAVIGFCMNIGLFSHLVIAWFGKVGEQICGLYYGAPQHDVSALFAFFTILITTINFVASVEVNFYPKYRHYYDLFNGSGSIVEIQKAEEDMLTVLEYEISYTARRQFYATAVMISLGILILNRLPLGFDSLMEGYFRILCVGYGIYAVGNVMMLILLYFTDYKGARNASIVFALVTTVGCILSLFLDAKYYGFAFAIGSMVYFLICWVRLRSYTERLPYHILSSQPIVAEEKYGWGTKLCEKLSRLEQRMSRRRTK